MTVKSLPSDLQQREARFQQAVRDAIADLHAHGLSAIQARDGYLVALQPDGTVRRLYKLRRKAGHAASDTAGRA